MSLACSSSSSSSSSSSVQQPAYYEAYQKKSTPHSKLKFLEKELDGNQVPPAFISEMSQQLITTFSKGKNSEVGEELLKRATVLHGKANSIFQFVKTQEIFKNAAYCMMRTCGPKSERSLEAAKTLEPFAHSDLRAAFEISRVFFNHQDIVGAKKYLTIASEEGNLEATFQLGRICKNEKDYGNARNYFHRAAGLGGLTVAQVLTAPAPVVTGRNRGIAIAALKELSTISGGDIPNVRYHDILFRMGDSGSAAAVNEAYFGFKDRVDSIKIEIDTYASLIGSKPLQNPIIPQLRSLKKDLDNVGLHTRGESELKAMLIRTLANAAKRHYYWAMNHECEDMQKHLGAAECLARQVLQSGTVPLASQTLAFVLIQRPGSKKQEIDYHANIAVQNGLSDPRPATVVSTSDATDTPDATDDEFNPFDF